MERDICPIAALYSTCIFLL